MPQTRTGGLCGLGFAVLLLIGGLLISLPSSAATGQRIQQFYADNAVPVLLQQVVDVLSLPLFLAFAAVLERRLKGGRLFWIIALFVVAVELATNIPPILLAVFKPPAEAAHTLTVVEDLMDSLLFVAIACFAADVGLLRTGWVRIVALAVAVVCFLRAVGSPVGITVLDALAPLAFLALVLLLSVSLLVATGERSEAGATS